MAPALLHALAQAAGRAAPAAGTEAAPAGGHGGSQRTACMAAEALLALAQADLSHGAGRTGQDARGDLRGGVGGSKGSSGRELLLALGAVPLVEACIARQGAPLSSWSPASPAPRSGPGRPLPAAAGGHAPHAPAPPLRALLALLAKALQGPAAGSMGVGRGPAQEPPPRGPLLAVLSQPQRPQPGWGGGLEQWSAEHAPGLPWARQAAQPQQKARPCGGAPPAQEALQPQTQHHRPMAWRPPTPSEARGGAPAAPPGVPGDTLQQQQQQWQQQRRQQQLAPQHVHAHGWAAGLPAAQAGPGDSLAPASVHLAPHGCETAAGPADAAHAGLVFDGAWALAPTHTPPKHAPPPHTHTPSPRHPPSPPPTPHAPFAAPPHAGEVVVGGEVMRVRSVVRSREVEEPNGCMRLIYTFEDQVRNGGGREWGKGGEGGAVGCVTHPAPGRGPWRGD